MVSQICLTTTAKLRYLQKKHGISPSKLYHDALVHVLRTKFKENPDTIVLTELRKPTAK